MNNIFNQNQTLRQTWTGLLLLLLAAGAQAQATEAEFSLLQAQDYAVKNSFTTKSTMYDAESADKATKELLATGFPQIEGSLQYISYIKVPDIIIPAGAFAPTEIRTQFQQPENLTMGVTANQLLFNGTWLVGLEASRSYEQLQNKNIRKSEQEVKDMIAQSYYLALVAAENVEIMQQTRATLAKTLDDTRALFQTGFSEKQDVDQLELSLNDVDIQISYAEQQAKNVVDLLKVQMGFPIQNEIRLTDTVETLIGADNTSITSLPFNAQTTAEYEVIKGGLTMQQLNVKAKKAAYLPTLGGFITFQTQAQRAQFNFFDPARPYLYGNFWGLALNVPILSGGQRKYSIEKAEVEVRRMGDLLSLTEQSATLEYRTAKSEFENALRVYESSRKSMELAQDIYNTSEIKYNEGVGSSFDLTQRSTQVITSQGTYIQAMLRLLQAKNRLAKSLNQY